jgi:FkbM family methyltransferase
MSSLTKLLRDITPHGFVEARRRRFRNSRLGLESSRLNPITLEEAAAACHFELWPTFLKQSEAWTLLDVGANEGEFVHAATTLARPKAVLAFEPQPACRPMLESVLSKLPRAQVVPAAVGAEAGEVEFNCTGNSKMASVLVPHSAITEFYSARDFSILRKLKVPVVRLDDVVPSGTDVGLLKLDVQGYELQALRGATRVLRETQAILVEANYVPHYDGAVDFDTLHRFLGDAGFRVHGISAPFMGKDGPLWADAMYVRR